jgi:hypothetical protein
MLDNIGGVRKTKNVIDVTLVEFPFPLFMSFLLYFLIFVTNISPWGKTPEYLRKTITLLQIFILKVKPRNLVQPRLLQSPAAAAAAASVTAAYSVITATDEKTRDIVAMDDLDIKRVQPANSSKKFVAEIDALNVEKCKVESRLAKVRDENSKLKDKLEMANLSYGELAKV